MFDYSQSPLQFVAIKAGVSLQYFFDQKDADRVPPGLDRD
jgi:hypothetical protein